MTGHRTQLKIVWINQEEPTVVIINSMDITDRILKYVKFETGSERFANFDEILYVDAIDVEI